MTYQKEYIEKQIIEIYNQISKLDSLKHSKTVEALFGQLKTASFSIEANIEVEELSQEVQNIRSILIKQYNEASIYSEKYFSSLLGSLQDNPLNNLHLCPIYTTYLKLIKMESHLISQHMNHVPTKIAFVGSGSIPFTSIVLAKFHFVTTTFHNFDFDPQANSLAESLVSRDPDLSKRMTFYTTDILDVSESLRDYDVVFLAALVGVDKKTKVKVIKHLEKHMAPDALLMFRSARGLRAFLFQVVDPSSDVKGFEVLTTYHPSSTDGFFNSIMVTRKLAGS